MHVTGKFINFFSLKVFIFIVSIFFINFNLVSTPINVSVQKLKKIKPSPTFFDGSISPTKSATLQTVKEGKMVYIAPIGEIVFAHVKDDNGNIVKKGTPVAIQDPSYIKIEVKLAKLALKKAMEAKNLAENNYMRNAELRIKNIVSEKDMETSREAFENAKIDVLNSETNLKKSLEDLENCYIYPLNTGQIQEVYCSQGEFVDKHTKIAKVTVMNPVYIKLKLPSLLTDNLDIHNSVKVYTTNTRTPEDGILTIDPIDPTTVNILLINKQIEVIPDDTPKKSLNLPKVHELRFVPHAYVSKELFMHGETENIKTKLAVPVNAIQKDSKGYFVWRANNQNENVKDIPVKFSLEKVYITPGDIVRDVTFLFNLSGYYRSLKDPGKLNKLDIIVLDPPNNAKNGEKVLYTRNKWLFSINQKVAVEIVGLNSPGFYVPESTVFDSILGTPKICINNNGKANFIDVKLTGYHDGYIRISSSRLKKNIEVILNSNNIFQEIYHGADIKVSNYIDVPKKVEENIALKYNITTPQYFKPKLKLKIKPKKVKKTEKDVSTAKMSKTASVSKTAKLIETIDPSDMNVMH